MPEYLSPGVYVEEIDAGPKPIEGVSTSTTGMVGVTARGPTTGKPELVTSFAEFVRNFGGFLEAPPSAIYNNWALDKTDGGRWWLFPLAVKGFFDNGGQQLYVKRVFSSTATAASANLGKGLVSEITYDASAGATNLRLRHVIGIDTASKLTIFNGNDGTQIGGGPLAVTAYDPATGQVTLGAGIGGDVQAKRNDFVEIFARDTSPVSNANATLTVRAKARGGWAKGLSVRVRPVLGSSLNLLRDAALSAPKSLGNTTPPTAAGTGPVNLAAASDLVNGDKIAVGNKTYAVSSVSNSGKTFNISPAGPGWAGAVAVARLQNETTTITNVAGTTITVDDIRDFDTGTHISVNGKEYATSGASVPNKTFIVSPAVPTGEIWVGAVAKRIGAANTGGATDTLRAWGASKLYKGALVELDNTAQKERFTVLDFTADTVQLSSKPANAYQEGHKLRVIEAEVATHYAPDGDVPTDELFSNLRLVNDKSLSYIVNNVNELSDLIELVEGAAYDSTKAEMFPTGAGSNVPWQLLTGGDDMLGDLSVDDFVGVDGGSGNRTGIQALEDIEDVAITSVPGLWSTTVQSALIQHCEQLRYRFAILDPQDNLTIEGIQSFREPIDTKYAALYYPWVEVRDPSVKRTVIAPPSGHMAGIYARVDVERGVHKAPANEVIRGIEKIAQDVNKREHDTLNPKNIDVLRYFPGRGYRVWGARVVTSDSAWKYINVRRLFIYVEHSIDNATQWVVFEPNDEPLWARVRQTIENFLTTTWRSGALQGSKASEAFFVKCDRTTMTQDDIDNGRLICLIGIAPVKPAEFVIFRIQQKTLDQTTT